MSTGPIALLAAADVTPVFTPPPFSALAARELGTLPNLENSIEADVTAATQMVNEGAAIIAAMDTDLSEPVNVLNEIAADDTELVIANFTVNSDFADSLFGSIDGALGVFQP